MRDTSIFFSVPGFEGRDIRDVSFGELKRAQELADRLRELVHKMPRRGSAQHREMTEILSELEELRKAS